MAHIIVVGNEKGGSGKSTASMHLTVALLRAGFDVAAIDLDLRQRTLLRYLQNRAAWSAKIGKNLPSPKIAEIDAEGPVPTDTDELNDLFEDALARFAGADFIIIDGPGSDTPLSRLAHAHADTILTPMNDSFIDFDLLAQIDPTSESLLGPSVYSEMVWAARKQRARAGVSRGIDWIVMRNRLASVNARNKRRVGKRLDELSKRIGFRVAPGLGDRVIYRELFPFGLTMLDLAEVKAPVKLTMSHVAARQELRNLIRSLNLPGVDAKAARV